MRSTITACVALSICAAGFAQGTGRDSRLGSRSATDQDAYDAARTRLVQERFGACVVKKYRAAAIAYLLKHPTIEDVREGRRLIRVLADGDCLVAAATSSADGVMMTFPGDTMRYALSDTLVRQEFASAPLRDLNRVAPLVHPKIDPEDFEPRPGKKVNAKTLAKLAEDKIKEQARIYLSEFGECVVRVDPVKSHGLLMTDVNSPAESDAFAALAPSLGECVIKGRTMTLNKNSVRGTVAYAYYRLANAPRLSAPIQGLIRDFRSQPERGFAERALLEAAE